MFWSWLTYIARLSTSTFFFFNNPATTEIYTLSLHDALPISNTATWVPRTSWSASARRWSAATSNPVTWLRQTSRSEEHTSELQSRPHLVCRLLLEKKKTGAPHDRESCRSD